MKFWKNFIKKLDGIIFWLKIIGTEKEYLVANEEPIHIINTVPKLILLENTSRTKIIIQNIGLEPCYIKLGDGISKDDFHFVLAPDTSPAFGNGGNVTLDNWHGEVYALADKETKISVLEY